MRQSFTDSVSSLMVKQAAEKKNLKEGVMDLLASMSDIENEKVHAWTTKNGYEKDDVEEEIYGLAKKYINFLRGGKSKGELDTSKVDPKILEAAIQIEMEHTPDRDTALKIVGDHVAEFGWLYYRTLPEFEKILAKITGKKAD